MEGIKSESVFSKSLGWAIIRAYYASFFAAHAILRLFGRACVQFDPEHMRKIDEIAQAVNLVSDDFHLESGFYDLVFENSSKILTASKVEDSHADTWKAFKNLINSLIENIDRTTAISKNKVETIDYLIKIKSNLSKSNSADRLNWLSKLRNNINYKHQYGVWFPHLNQLYDSKEIIRKVAYWKNNPADSINVECTHDVEVFMTTTVSLVALLKELLIQICSRGESKNVFSDHALKAINLLRAT